MTVYRAPAPAAGDAHQLISPRDLRGGVALAVLVSGALVVVVGDTTERLLYREGGNAAWWLAAALGFGFAVKIALPCAWLVARWRRRPSPQRLLLFAAGPNVWPSLLLGITGSGLLLLFSVWSMLGMASPMFLAPWALALPLVPWAISRIAEGILSARVVELGRPPSVRRATGAVGIIEEARASDDALRVRIGGDWSRLVAWAVPARLTEVWAARAAFELSGRVPVASAEATDDPAALPGIGAAPGEHTAQPPMLTPLGLAVGLATSSLFGATAVIAAASSASVFDAGDKQFWAWARSLGAVSLGIVIATNLWLPCAWFVARTPETPRPRVVAVFAGRPAFWRWAVVNAVLIALCAGVAKVATAEFVSTILSGAFFWPPVALLLLAALLPMSVLSLGHAVASIRFVELGAPARVYALLGRPRTITGIRVDGARTLETTARGVLHLKTDRGWSRLFAWSVPSRFRRRWASQYAALIENPVAAPASEAAGGARPTEEELER